MHSAAIYNLPYLTFLLTLVLHWLWWWLQLDTCWVIKQPKICILPNSKYPWFHILPWELLRLLIQLMLLVSKVQKVKISINKGVSIAHWKYTFLTLNSAELNFFVNCTPISQISSKNTFFFNFIVFGGRNVFASIYWY